MSPHEQSLIDTICPAIQSRTLIRFWYKNTTSGLQDWRVVEPYLIGKPLQKHIQLSGWVLPTPEGIMAGQKEGWRTYLLINISEVQILDEKFERNREDFDPKRSGMNEIFCVGRKDPFMKIA